MSMKRPVLLRDVLKQYLVFFQICQPNGSLPHPVFPVDKTSSSYQQGRSDIPNGALSRCSVDTLDNSLCRSLGMQLPPLDGFAEYLNQVIIIQDLTYSRFYIISVLTKHFSSCNLVLTTSFLQFPAICEDDLQSFVQMGFSQNPNKDMTLQSQGITTIFFFSFCF